MEGARHHTELRQLSQWFDTGDNGDGDTHLTRLVHKGKVFLVVVEQLRHGILRTQVLLLLQILHIHLQVGCLLMFLGIAGHTDVKLRPRVLDRLTIGKESLVEALHLTDQVGGVGMAARRRREHAVLLRLVATQQQQVGDTQELQVQQFILDILYRRTTTNHVGLHRHMKPLLDGCCHGNGARAQTHALTLKAPIAQFLVHILAVMRRNINECRIQLTKLFDIGKKLIRARPLQRGQHLKRELMLVVIRGYQVCYGHNWVQRY